MTSVRYNSTVPAAPLATTTAAAGTPLADELSTTTATASFGTPLAEELSANATGNLSSAAAEALTPGTIGYLHSLGVDHGWGPSTMVQALLETIHVSAGLPWWGTILASVILVRTVQFPFYCKMSSNAAKMKEIAPLIAPKQKMMMDHQKRGETQEMMMVRAETLQMYQTAGINKLWLFFPFTQIPIFYGFYKTLRAMADVPVPAFVDDGLLWFSDLSVSDPYLLIPAAASGLIGLQVYMGGEGGTNQFSKSVKLAMGLGLPMVSFAISYAWPAALVFYMFINTLFGVVQSTVLKNRRFREYMGLYPLTSSAESPLKPVLKPRLNIVKPKVVEATVAPVAGKVRQIGAPGGILDRLTGGKDEDDGSWSIKKWRMQVSRRRNNPAGSLC